MLITIDYKKEKSNLSFAEIDAEVENMAIDVNHIIRVNGSSAFPMPKPKRNTSIFRRFIGRDASPQ